MASPLNKTTKVLDIFSLSAGVQFLSRGSSAVGLSPFPLVDTVCLSFVDIYGRVKNHPMLNQSNRGVILFRCYYVAPALGNSVISFLNTFLLVG